MEELHFTGNCLKGSRPILSFDAAFEKESYLCVIKELFLQIFGVPEGARKSKPFIDHILGFTFADGKIWIRNYQISEVEKGNGESVEDDEAARVPTTKGGSKETAISLIEIGPRFVLTPIVIQEGSFCGPIIYENKQFVSPNQVRADLRRAKAGRYNVRAEKHVEMLAKKADLGLRTNGGKELESDALDSREMFA
jgi:ribosome biogenesis protein BRX1